MKMPIVKIFSSSNKDMKHYVFRSKDKKIEKTIEEFVNNQTPVGMINEAEDTDLLENSNLKNITMSIEENPKKNEDFSALTLPFEFCKPGSVFNIEIKNKIHAEMCTTLTFYLGINNIFKVERKIGDEIEIITDQSYISEHFKLTENKNCILINKNIFNNCVAAFFGKMEVYYYYDDGTKFDSDCNPSVAHGIYKPIINIIETKDYLSFYQEEKNRKNIYYYNVVSKLSDSTISEISNTQVCEVSEPAENIEYKIQSTNFYYTKPELEDSDWEDVEITNPLNEIKIYKKDLVGEIIPTENFAIYANDDNLKLQNERELKVTNIWNPYNRKLMLRDKKVFRAINSMGDIKQISDLIEFDDREEVLIDKILILKKDVTEAADKTAPIALNDGDAETLKIFVRQGGIYYKDFFLNNDNTNDYDEPVPSYIISAVTLDSRFPLLVTKDNCIYGNKYNYTVYLYDELGKTSDPISVVL